MNGPPDFRLLFESMPGLYLVLAPDLTMVAVSDGHLRATAKRREEVVGRHVFDVFPDNPDDPTADGTFHLSASFDRVLRSGQTDTMPVQRYDIPGPESAGGRFEERFWRIVNSPIFNASGKVAYLLNHAEEVTAEVRAREGQQRSEEDLRQRTDELERVNVELESFAYSVSHDLRAPLRSISGFAQVIEEDFGDRLGTEGQGVLARIRAATGRMADLIDDLLKLSQVGRWDLRREPIDLSALVRNVAASVRSRTPDRDVQVTIAEGAAVEGDVRLLTLAVENLVENAFKFTSRTPAARIEFGLEGADPEGAPVYFLRDNGAGFDMAYADKLFGPFQRLHASAEFPGTGIGLATVRRVLHRHKGRIWAEAAPGTGATFYFTLTGGNG